MQLSSELSNINIAY